MLHILLHFCLVSRDETKSSRASRRYSYTKVLDNRKHPIRGLWRRNGQFCARIVVEDDEGRKTTPYVPLAAKSAAEAQDELRGLLVERKENRLRPIGHAPKLAEYIVTFLDQREVSGIRATSFAKDKTQLARWGKSLGHLRLDQLRAKHISAFITEIKKKGYAPRTANLFLISIRVLLKAARRDGHIKSMPTEGIAAQKMDIKKRSLITPADLERLCRMAGGASKNGAQLADYLRLMTFAGSRRSETLRLRWVDVDFERGQLTIGAEGDAKNREPRHVDFNQNLESHLRAMHQRRAPDSQWLFPSPQRGDKDARARSFMESLYMARAAAGLEHFGFHDCRHHFVSYCVMSGIDFMTIARWVGHKDGGILIGKVYGHLSNEHARAQASRLHFGPSITATDTPA